LGIGDNLNRSIRDLGFRGWNILEGGKVGFREITIMLMLYYNIELFDKILEHNDYMIMVFMLKKHMINNYSIHSKL
jgi:hypothetical protein